MKSIVALYVFGFFTVQAFPPIFSTLAQLQEYAKSMDEYPKNDALAWVTPSYRTFWRKQVPSRWENFLYTMRFRARPLWHIEAFNDLMAKVTKINESSSYIDRFVIKMKPAPGTQFVIWGDVQGAFHSLVRVLTYLKKNGFINEQLEIIKPYTYFVFNGDLVNRGPYSLEVLTVIMRLIERNPQRIFYLKGRQEDAGFWKNFNLKDELILRAGVISKREIPLAQELDRFFNTLPLALYLVNQEDAKAIDVVRISYFDRKFAELDEEHFNIFFKEPNTAALNLFKLGQKSENYNKKINVRAVIEAENRSSVYRPSPGLVQLEADKGATAWTQLSSPIESYRYLQDFYFDAFVILDIGKQLTDWTVTLYNQDVRELLGIQKHSIFNLLTGLRDYQKEKIEQAADPFASLYKQLTETDNEIEKLKSSCPQLQKFQKDKGPDASAK
jgi:hypothetical protein